MKPNVKTSSLSKSLETRRKIQASIRANLAKKLEAAKDD